jgi:hypothetical protein
MTLSHDKICLLRNRRFALVAAVLFAGFGTVSVLKLTNVLPLATGQGPTSTFFLLVSAVLVGSLLTFFTCLLERIVLTLLLLTMLLRIFTQTVLVASRGKYEYLAAAIAYLSSAAICVSAVLRSKEKRDSAAT